MKIDKTTAVIYLAFLAFSAAILLPVIIEHKTNTGQSNAGAKLTEQSSVFDFPNACRSYISKIMGKDLKIITVDYHRKSDDVVGVSYIRPSDGKLWKYECGLSEDMIVWRGVDLFSQGEGPGRWRTEDAEPVSAFSSP